MMMMMVGQKTEMPLWLWWWWLLRTGIKEATGIETLRDGTPKLLYFSSVLCKSGIHPAVVRTYVRTSDRFPLLIANIGSKTIVTELNIIYLGSSSILYTKGNNIFKPWVRGGRDTKSKKRTFSLSLSQSIQQAKQSKAKQASNIGVSKFQQDENAGV